MKSNNKLTICLFLLLCLLVNHMAEAQVLFAQDFEAGLSPMKVVDVDMNTPDVNVADLGGKWTTTISSSGNGTTIAAQSSWYNPPGTSDDWLITPLLSINGSGKLIRWEAIAPNFNFRDGYQVLVSTTDDNTSSFTDTLFEIEAELNEWQNRSMSLDNYAGQNIYIAFRNNTEDKDVIYIDNIWVGTPSNDDARLLALDIGCPSPPGSRQLSVDFQNQGSNAITALDISYTFGESSKTESLGNLNVESGQFYNFTFPQPINLPQGDQQKIKVTLSNINGNADPDQSNNIDSLTFDVAPSAIDFAISDTDGNQQQLFNELQNGKPVILDFFASWCTPCEISTPALNSLYVNNGSDEKMQVFGLSVEPDDDEATVKALDWGATYPKFQYYESNAVLDAHFALDHCFNATRDLPFFVMLCPDSEDGDPAKSSIVRADVGFELNLFSTFYQNALDQCFEKITAVQDLESLVHEIKISPNPAYGNILLEFFAKEQNEFHLRIFDATGKLIQQQGLGLRSGYISQRLDTNSFPNGFYWLSLSANDKVLSRKFVVARE